MGDLISRNDAIEALDRIFNYCEEIDHHLPEEERTGYKMLQDIWLVSNYLRQSVHRPTGHDTWNIQSLFRCSECGAECVDTLTWMCDINFCPNCGCAIEGGARMEGSDGR